MYYVFNQHSTASTKSAMIKFKERNLISALTVKFNISYMGIWDLSLLFTHNKGKPPSL